MKAMYKIVRKKELNSAVTLMEAADCLEGICAGVHRLDED